MTDGRQAVSTKLTLWLYDEEAEDDGGDGVRALAGDGKNIVAAGQDVQDGKGGAPSDLHYSHRRHPANAAHFLSARAEREVSNATNPKVGIK